MKSIKRSIRRHHYRRLKNKRKGYWGYEDNWRHTKMCKVCLGMVTRTPKSCSCWMCGNPRKWWKEKTMQEKIFDMIFKESLQEI